MSQPQRDLINAIIQAIRSNLAVAQDWEFHRYEPLHHQGNGDHCAIWFDGEVNDPGGNTTSPSGHLDMRETYRLRFWRQAPEGARQIVDEEGNLAIEEIYDDISEVLMNNQTYGATTQYYVRLVAGSPIMGLTEAKIRGFEFQIMANRARGFS
jgi:hypothetical protein